MTTRFRVLAATFAATALLAPGSLPGAAAAGAPALAGTTVVTASRTTVMAVRLAKPVSFSVYDHTRIDGNGRIVGFALKRDGAWDAPSAHAYRTGFCARAACPPTWANDKTGAVWAPGGQNLSQGTLPAGNYKLYVLTDGAPVRVTLTLAGLPGRVTLAPRTPARAQFATPAPTDAVPAAAPALFAGGSTRAVGGRGALHVTVAWKDHPLAEVRSAAGPCYYVGRPPASDKRPAFQAPCTGGNGGFPFIAVSRQTGAPAPTPVGPGRYVSAIISGALVAPGEISYGAFHNTAGPVTSAHLHQLWLDFA